ncbi:MAG: HIT family protein [Syntrophobacteraceae bacterium]
MADCIFCQIIRGQLPCAKVYEDERVISFLDINPVNAGHTLVVPKTHYETLFDIPAEALQECTLAAQKIARAVFKGTKAVGLNFFQNNFRPAGQLIDHVHFHLIPRYPQDNFLTSWPGKPYQQGELEKVLKKIKAEYEQP